MKDNFSFRMILKNDKGKVFIDFNKGYDHVFSSLQKLGYKFPHDVKLSDVIFKFTHQSNEELKYISQITDKNDYIMDIFRAYQYFKYEKGFDDNLRELIELNQVASIKEILINGNLHQIHNIQKNQNVFIDRKQSVEDMTFQEITFFNKLALFTPCRINSKILPKGVYKYECQHDDEQNGTITMIGKCIHVNFLGTILTTKKIGLYRGYRNVDRTNNIVFYDTKNMKLSLYLRKQQDMNKNQVR